MGSTMLPLLLASLLVCCAATTPIGSSQQPPASAAAADDHVAGSSAAFPAWVKPRLLRGKPKVGDWRVDAVVSKMARHKRQPPEYLTIGAALGNAPQGEHRYVILVKADTYEEQVSVTRNNVVLLGEGMNKTVITGNKSNKTHTLLLTPTLTALGHGFIAHNMTIRNEAGPDGHQAIALRLNSNRSIIYNCSLEGFQDTVYAENNIQLFFGCDIYGNIDFVFGNAKAIFHSCRILVHAPKDKSVHNVITAQGRDSPTDDDSGFVFQNCVVTAASPAEDFAKVDTYLGRPWKKHSRVVFMDSFLDQIINPEGWVSWTKGVVVDETTRTVSYLEYNNHGPQSDTRGRVKWDGFRVINASEAAKFTPEMFIHSGQWVPPFIRFRYINRMLV